MASNLETTKKGYELFKQGDISTLVKDIVDDTCTWISPGLRTNCLGQVISRGGRRLQISSRESLRIWILPSLRRVK